MLDVEADVAVKLATVAAGTAEPRRRLLVTENAHRGHRCSSVDGVQHLDPVRGHGRLSLVLRLMREHKALEAHQELAIHAEAIRLLRLTLPTESTGVLVPRLPARRLKLGNRSVHLLGQLLVRGQRILVRPLVRLPPKFGRCLLDQLIALHLFARACEGAKRRVRTSNVSVSSISLVFVR